MRKLCNVIVFVMAACLLTGCEPSTDEKTANYILPRGMENCHIFKMLGNGKEIYAVVCPNSTVTTTSTQQNGKMSYSNSVVVRAE